MPGMSFQFSRSPHIKNIFGHTRDLCSYRVVPSVIYPAPTTMSIFQMYWQLVGFVQQEIGNCGTKGEVTNPFQMTASPTVIVRSYQKSVPKLMYVELSSIGCWYPHSGRNFSRWSALDQRIFIYIRPLRSFAYSHANSYGYNEHRL